MAAGRAVLRSACGQTGSRVLRAWPVEPGGGRFPPAEPRGKAPASEARGEEVPASGARGSRQRSPGGRLPPAKPGGGRFPLAEPRAGPRQWSQGSSHQRSPGGGRFPPAEPRGREVIPTCGARAEAPGSGSLRQFAHGPPVARLTTVFARIPRSVAHLVVAPGSSGPPQTPPRPSVRASGGRPRKWRSAAAAAPAPAPPTPLLLPGEAPATAKVLPRHEDAKPLISLACLASRSVAHRHATRLPLPRQLTTDKWRRTP